MGTIIFFHPLFGNFGYFASGTSIGNFGAELEFSSVLSDIIDWIINRRKAIVKISGPMGSMSVVIQLTQ